MSKSTGADSPSHQEPSPSSQNWYINTTRQAAGR